MRKNTSGFTLAELAIVIAVIGILATITIVSYNGITQRARTAQTVSAAEQWIKILQSYKARNGSYPSGTGCLGANYNWGVSGSKTKGSEIGQCGQNDATTGIADNPTIDAALAPYMTSQPTPAMVTASRSSTFWRRGLTYIIDTQVSPAVSRVDATFEGKLTAATCPVIGNVTAFAVISFTTDGTTCAYRIGPQASY